MSGAAAAGVGAGAARVGAGLGGGVSEPFFVDLPKGDRGTDFSMRFGFSIGFGAGIGGAAGVIAGAATTSGRGIDAKRIVITDAGCGATCLHAAQTATPLMRP